MTKKLLLQQYTLSVLLHPLSRKNTLRLIHKIEPVSILWMSRSVFLPSNQRNTPGRSMFPALGCLKKEERLRPFHITWSKTRVGIYTPYSPSAAVWYWTGTSRGRSLSPWWRQRVSSYVLDAETASRRLPGNWIRNTEIGSRDRWKISVKGTWIQPRSASV